MLSFEFNLVLVLVATLNSLSWPSGRNDEASILQEFKILIQWWKPEKMPLYKMGITSAVADEISSK